MKNIAVPAAARVYRALLHLYPGAFRSEFGAEMACDFEDATSEAMASGGWSAVLVTWSIVSRDLLFSIAAQWLRSGLPVIFAISAAWAISCCVLVAQGVPQNLVIFDTRNPEQEVEIMLLGLAVVVLLIVATVLVTGWFWITVLKRRSRA
jgi:hypothetical protein